MIDPLSVVDSTAMACRITLETLTMIPMCESVETTEGVPLTVTGVAQCKVCPLLDLCVRSRGLALWGLRD